MQLEKEICEKNYIEFIYFRHQKNKSAPRRNINNIKVIGNRTNGKNKLINSCKKLLRSINVLDILYKTVYRLKKELDQQSLTYQNAYKLLKREQPSAILVTNDIRIDLEIFLLKVAKHLHIPTIQIGWSWTQSNSQYTQLQLHRESHGVIKKNDQWKVNLCKYLIPDIYGEIDNKRILFNDPFVILVSKYFGLKSSSPINKGKNVDGITVPSNFQKNVYLNRAINREKIFLTGDPSNDKLIHLRKEKYKIKGRLLSALDIKESKTIVFIASSPLGYVSNKRNQTTIDIIKMLLSLSLEIQVVFKPHPAEDIISFEYLKNISDRVTVTDNFSVSELAISSHLFITIASSSLIEAVALDIPVVIYDFTKINYIDRYTYTRSVKRVFNLESMKIAVKNILLNVDVRKKTIKMQRHRIKPFAILDGKCTERNASVIMSYLSE